MKNIFSFLLLSFFFFNVVSPVEVNAQNPKKFVEENDPEARAVFEKIKKRYDAYNAMKVEVSIEIEIPEQAAIKQKGTLIQKGDQYKLDMPDQMHISDGEELWLYLKEKNQVQIHAISDDEDAMMTPKDLLKFYERDDFIYVLTNEFFDKNRTVQQIELKPLERDGDIRKFRVEVNKKTAEIISIKAFFTDGVRYNVYIDKLTPNPYVATNFVFNKSDYPGVKVEDLRID